MRDARAKRAAARSSSRSVATIIGILTLAFAARVVGQMLVALAGVSWLPPMECWMSGLLPYPLLLAAQLAILFVLGKTTADAAGGRGTFTRPRPRLGRALVVAGSVYFGANFLRTVAGGLPAYAWLGEPIPTAFHFVLATIVLTVGIWHARPCAVSAPVVETRASRASWRQGGAS